MKTAIYVLVIVLCASIISGEKCAGLLEWKEICCGDIGCFNKDAPFSGLPLPCCPEGEEVTYMLYTRNTRMEPEAIRLGQQIPADFSGERGSVFVSHGWMGGGDIDWVLDMKEGLLDKDDLNVIVVNWAYGASYVRYPQSASNTRTVGAMTAAMMEQLVTQGETTYTQIWCIGHSLGSHMCGHAGNRTPQKIGRITGLDPAGPWFEGEVSLEVGLNPKSAELVDIIHSDTKGSINTYGTTRPLGHVDFYPNGLGSQPGCVTRKRKRRAPTPDNHGFLGCSHGRAVEYFIESLTEGDCFVSRQICTDIYNMPSSCSDCGWNNGTCAVMGYNAQNTSNHGIFYLQTRANNSPPHCLG